MDEKTLLDMDFQDLSDSDLAVIFTMSDKPVLKTRLQKITLLFDEIYDPENCSKDYGAYFFGGYSDEIDESATKLVSAGIIDETHHGYVLTDYGRKLREYAKQCIENDDDEIGMRIISGITNIVKSLYKLPDKNVVGLTYYYYKETAVKSTIKESVEILNSKARYNGKKLSEISRSEFETMLRNGEELFIG